MTDLTKAIRRADDPREAVLSADPFAVRAAIEEAGGPTAFARDIEYGGRLNDIIEVAYYNRRFCDALEKNVDPADATEQVYRRRAHQLEAENARLLEWRTIISETIQRGHMEFKPQPAPKKERQSKRDERIAILNIGDVHIGEQVHASETGGVAQYNWDTFCHRLNELKHRLQSVIDEQRLAYPVNTLILHLLGDIGTSEGVFDKQLARLDLFLADQITMGSWKMAEFILFAASLFNRVEVRAVAGNHTPKSITMNSDQMMYMMMALLLSKQRNVNFLISGSHFMGYEISEAQGMCKWPKDGRTARHLITHGHQAKRHMSIPYYGLERMAQRYVNMTNIPWDLNFVGHSHEDASFGRVVVNGCWPGGTEYSTEVMQGASQPSQALLFWHPHRCVTSEHELYLADRPELKSVDEHGVYTPLEKTMVQLSPEEARCALN